jgi:simple sugar transport system ATP-binding protein
MYPGQKTRANNNISLNLRKGEILCLAGENGAGKSTLMKILCGLTDPTAGEIFIRGKPEKIDSPLTANRLGIGMVHQHFMLFPEFTAAENIVMGMEPRQGGIFYNKAKANTDASNVIAAHHFSITADRPVSSLTVGEMQQVEICKILYRNADIIILDEPTAVLTEQEIASLFKTFRALAAVGKSLILITHKLKEIRQVSDRVAVLRKGELIGVRETSEIDEYEISRMMVGAGTAGAEIGGLPPAAAGAVVRSESTGKNGAEAVISFDDVTVLRRGQKRPLLEKVSFTVKGGEILGFAGVGGNGLGVLEAVLGGFLHPAKGRILHRAKDISRLNIRRLRNQGLAYVPADRLRVGSALGMTVDDNIAVDRRSEFFKGGIFGGVLDRSALRNFSDNLIRRYGIAGTGAGITGDLSGGNIQKLILAREIDQFRDYIVFSEPSWGLDIAGSAFVYREIAKLRDRGAAVILISTNLDEILGCADRIIVMYRGKIAAEFNDIAGIPAVKEEIGACMLGLKTGAQSEAISDQ